MEKAKGQQLVRIPEKDHYYFDSKSRRIYFLRKALGELTKFSTEIIWDENPKTLIKAARVVAKKEQELKDKKKIKPINVNRLLGYYIDDFIIRSEDAGDKLSTLKSKRNAAGHLKEFFEGYAPIDLIQNDIDEEKKPDLWLAFVDHFQKKNPGYNMFNITKYFKAICTYLHENGIIAKRPNIFNPNRKKEEAKRRKKRHRSYTPAEIHQMDSVCNDNQRLALWLGYDLAFRLDDCVKLKWERIHFSNKGSFIQFFGDENKTGYAGKVPISDTCVALLKERQKTSDSPWVFPQALDPSKPMLTQQIRFEGVVRESGVNYGSHHILRHTRLTEDFGNPALKDTLVMKIRRVSLAVAIEHYIHPTEDDLEKLRNTAVTKIGDKSYV